MSPVASLPNTLKLLAEPTRLRLVGLLAIEELTVQELVAITGYPQSRTSNHLALLKRSGLVSDRREGSWSFYRLVEPSKAGPITPELFAATVAPWLAAEEGQRDVAAVESVREQRRESSRRTHDRLAASWNDGLQQWATRSLRAETYSALVPEGLVVADLGCGSGFLAEFLVARGAQVIAIDHAPAMLAQGKHRVPHGAEFRRGELDALPLADGEVDAAFANLVWHHVADEGRAAREAFRVLKPGGTLVITDLLPHGCEWLRETMGDLRLGLDPRQVVATLARAGFKNATVSEIVDRCIVTGKPGSAERAELPMFLVRATRPGSSAGPVTGRKRKF